MKQFQMEQERHRRLVASIRELEEDSNVDDLASLARRLAAESTHYRNAMQWFVLRVDRGEVHSKQTYQRFKELLEADEDG